MVHIHGIERAGEPFRAIVKCTPQRRRIDRAQSRALASQPASAYLRRSLARGLWQPRSNAAYDRLSALSAAAYLASSRAIKA